jgi:NAD(P)H-quinone oxidoreductase subunit 5
MFVVTWILTSLGLHQLLLHYSDRPAAQRAAWTKFAISRIGDAALIGALVTVYQLFGTLEFAELFTAARALTTNLPELNAVGFLLVAGAATKSAQFPFHTWLPQTLETPTPVSALMHAGIVNAGGYLIIRTSPLVALTPGALTSLALIGGFTACFAAIVMLTQTSIKKSLAYSTIAQMGFMLLQCGLGAYSAAMLHILAHSLYKAHAFLASGSVIAERAALGGKTSANSRVSVLKLAIVGIVMMATLGISLKMFGIDLATKSGGLLLGGVLCLALTHWIGQVLRQGNSALAMRAVAVACGLCILYACTYGLVDWTIAANLPAASGPASLWLVSTIIAIGFVGMFTLQFLLVNNHSTATLAKWHVHAANGFYLESLLRRVLRPLATNGK